MRGTKTDAFTVCLQIRYELLLRIKKDKLKENTLSLF
jgi:hypothetical protein